MLTTTAEDGSEVRAYDEGTGPPILIVHPGLDDGRSYKRVSARLADRFRVVRLVRRQYRLDLSGGCSIGQEVGHVTAMTKVIGQPPLLFGHSSGAIVALEAMEVAPASFAGAVLYEPPLVIGPPLGGEAARNARAALVAGRPRQAMTTFVRDIVCVPPTMAFLSAAFVTASPRYRPLIPRQLDDVDAIDALGCRLDTYDGIDALMVLVGGERSPVHQSERLDALQARLPKAERVMLSKRGHDANFWAPGEVAAIIATVAARVLA